MIQGVFESESVPSRGSGPFAEQRALAEGRAVARLERGVVTVAGPDRLSWLDSMTSQSLTGLRPGESAESLLLDPNGRIEHVLRVVDDGATTWLIVDAAEAAPLTAWLDRMRFMLRVEVADRSADFAVIGRVSEPEPAKITDQSTPVIQPVESASQSTPVIEPVENTTAEQAGPDEPDQQRITWRDPWRTVQPGGWQYATAADHPGDAWAWIETLVAPEAVPADAVSPAAAEALRIAAWRPSWATEVDERAIPNELDWLRSAVHLDKGCYRGQETVAKVHNLGHPPRRIAFLHLDGSDNVYAAHGDDIVIAGTEEVVGRVTSAANHFELGPIALAMLKRSVDPDAALEVVHDGVRLSAAQELVVPPSAGATADVPRIPRLGAVRR